MTLKNIIKNIIVMPSSNKLKLMYKFNNVSKNIDELQNTNQVITLIRYFGNIMPLFYKVNENLNNSYVQLYKDPTIEISVNDNNVYIHKFKDNVNKYKGVYTLTKIVDNCNIYNYLEDIEYKHFNDNKIYYVDKDIIIDFKDTYMVESQIHEDFILNEFRKYVLKQSNNTLLENEILFLYNKYNCIKDLKTTNIKDIKNKQLYHVKLHFTLK